MLATEFVTVYRDELPPEQIHNGNHSQFIGDAQDWSYDFGRVLHRSLSTDLTPMPAADLPDPRDYRRWMNANSQDFFNRGEAGGSDANARCVSELNFHFLNRPLLPMWGTLARGSWPSEKIRRESFGNMRKDLGIEGLIRYVVRKKFVDVAGSEVLFEERNKLFSDATNGALQEFDAGIVMLDAVQRHPNLLLLPAPLQFERGKDGSRNVDFVVVDFVGKRAVGAQVKTHVWHDTAARYDAERVVLIDGNVDFDSVLSMRTQKGSSKQRTVDWPGMLAVKRTLDLPAPGKGMSGPERMENIRIRHMAQQALGPIKVDYNRAVSRIEQRILEQL